MGRRQKHGRFESFFSSGSSFVIVLAICLIILFLSIDIVGKVKMTILQASLRNIHIFEIANTDYQLDASRAEPSLSSEARYPDLIGGRLEWEGVDFHIPVSYLKRKPIHWTIYTSCGSRERSVSIPLEMKKSKKLFLLVDGCQVDPDATHAIVETKISYADGTWTEKLLIANQDIWTFHEKKNGFQIPSENLAWEFKGGQTLNVVEIPMDTEKVPEQLTLTTLGSPDEAGIVLFAVHQVRGKPSLKGLLNAWIIDPVKSIFKKS